MNATSITADMSARLTGQPAQTAARHIRIDIQILRGLAILMVVLHHARMPAPTGGFLGVDIFFVVSGYLMTGLIDEGLDNRRFTLAGFYARRARRLLPAAYAMLTVTAIVAPFLLDTQEYGAFVQQLTGSFGFFSNVVLWRQTDYFGSGAPLKPLLHMWSLSLEEQYYLLLPIMMMLTPRRLRLALTLALVVASAFLCAWFRATQPSAVFYLLPTRAWELGLGSLTALLLRRDLLRPGWPDGIRALGWGVVAIIPCLVDESGHPGWPALLVCLGTAVLLIPGRGRMARPGVMRPMTLLGDRSYSLYLVHWPVFAFANNIAIVPIPLAVMAGLILVCLAWMEAQYRLVERPFRGLRLTPRSIGVLVAIPVVALAASFTFHGVTRPAGADPRRENPGLSFACAFNDHFSPSAACASGPAPTTLVWGDSVAMALVPGLAETVPGGIVQATKFTCGPFDGIAPFNGQANSVQWARGCTAFNESVMAYVLARPHIRTIVLSSATVQYVPGGEPLPWRLLARAGDGTEKQEALSTPALAGALDRTATRLRAAGKRVIFFAPPPANGMDTARCLARHEARVPVVGASPDCAYPAGNYLRVRAPVRMAIDIMARRSAVPIISLDAAICGDGRCRAELDGTPIYRDPAHLSVEGSRLLARHMGWARAVAENAR